MRLVIPARLEEMVAVQMYSAEPGGYLHAAVAQLEFYLLHPSD
jgi:hypothetical protein